MSKVKVMKSDAQTTIKQQKELIENLKRENLRLKIENSSIKILKEKIHKLHQEKMQLSKQIIEVESQLVLYKDNKGKDEMLLNPVVKNDSNHWSIDLKDTEALSSSKQIDSLNSTKNDKKFYRTFLTVSAGLEIKSQHFCLLSKSSLNSFNSNIPPNKQMTSATFNNIIKSKNEEILLLKSELNKKNNVISSLKINRSIPSTSKKKRNKSVMGVVNKVKFIRSNCESFCILKPNITTNIKKTSSFLCDKSDFDSKSQICEMTEGNNLEKQSSKILLERNIKAELNNLLLEKRNFVLKTLTKESMSFDVVDRKFKCSFDSENVSNIRTIKNSFNDSSKNYIKTDIDLILEFIQSRKKNVEKLKKFYENKLIT